MLEINSGEQMLSMICNDVLCIYDDICINFESYSIEYDFSNIYLICDNLSSKYDIAMTSINANNIDVKNLQCKRAIYCNNLNCNDLNYFDICAGSINCNNIDAKYIRAESIKAKNIIYRFMCIVYDDIICESIAPDPTVAEKSKHMSLFGKVIINEPKKEKQVNNNEKKIDKNIADTLINIFASRGLSLDPKKVYKSFCKLCKNLEDKL